MGMVRTLGIERELQKAAGQRPTEGETLKTKDGANAIYAKCSERNAEGYVEQKV
jgi:hypothetical protein